MGRVEKKMYRRAAGKRRLRQAMAVMMMIAVGAAWIWRHGGEGLLVEPVLPPTPTPVTADFDQTVETREIALPETAWYAIQTGIYSTKEAAQEQQDAYASRGAPGYVKQDGAKWRVLIACYGEKDDASAVRERLRLYQSVESYLYTWTCPEITLRLTGMVGQMDVAESGLTLVDQAANALRDEAAALDAGERSAQEAWETIDALDGQITLWRETAVKRFDAPYPGLIEAEIALADAWPALCKNLKSQTGATALSAQMKLAAMQLYDGCCALREKLME